MMYAKAILDAEGSGRVVPGLAAFLDSTNAAQRQKRLLNKAALPLRRFQWRGATPKEECR